MRKGGNMYRYFMGKKSNLHTRSTTDPVVVAVERNAQRVLDEWLHRYRLDFDNMMLVLEAMLQRSVVKIGWEDAKNLILYPEESSLLFASLLEEEEPRILLKVHDDEYLVRLGELPEVESCYQTMRGYRLGYEKKNNRIFFSREGTSIILDMEQFDRRVYEAIKKKLHELDEWSNLLSLVLFVKGLGVGLCSYELLLLERDEKSLESVKLFVIQNEIFRYNFGNGSGQYTVDNDGCWEVTYAGVTFKYCSINKKCNIYVPKELKKHAEKYKQCIEDFQELLQTMFSTMNFINGILER